MRRRRQRETAARYVAPIVFLVAVTIAILLVKAGLSGADEATTTTTVAVSTAAATTSAVTTTPKRPPAKKPKPEYHVVESGDTFGTIAADFDTSVEALQALNPGVSSNSLTVGQRIRVK